VPNAARTKNITKMSSSAMRDSTRWNPSSAISRPAAQPSTVEWNMRRATRTMIRMERVPMTAPAMRQPHSLYPKVCSPIAIIHLPSGGCTT
jgi:hypothetical protein